jgi:hypothetical protein
MNCYACGADVAAHWVQCANCGIHLGFPNVRTANAHAEVTHLDARHREVRVDAEGRGVGAVLRAFEAAITLASRAVICRPLGTLNRFIQSQRGPFQTFYQQVAWGRIPEDNSYDRVRGAVDFLFFSYYGEHIHFAALTLNRSGLPSYGNCHLILRNASICARASLFRENTLTYCQRTGQAAAQPLPVTGWRAGWDQRHLLAVAKCGPEITMVTQPADFVRILMRSRSASDADDTFIEVHVHDPLSALDVEEMRWQLPPGANAGVEQTLFDVVREYFLAAGAACQVLE